MPTSKYLRFQCRFCNEETFLPSSILREKSPHQPRLATGDQCIAVLCPKCTSVSGCKAESLPIVRSGIQDQFLDPDDKSVIAILIQCDNRNCGTHIQVHVIAKPTQDSDIGKLFAGLSQAALTWKWDEEIRCGAGYPAWLPPKSITLS
jgi:hypothetical protein